MLKVEPTVFPDRVDVRCEREKSLSFWPKQLEGGHRHLPTWGGSREDDQKFTFGYGHEVVTICLLYVRLRSFRLSNYLGRYYYSHFTKS